MYVNQTTHNIFKNKEYNMSKYCVSNCSGHAEQQDFEGRKGHVMTIETSKVVKHRSYRSSSHRTLYRNEKLFHLFNAE